MGVKSQHSEYVKMLPKWERCEAVSCGTDAIHEGGETYLPRMKDQSAEDYNKFKQRTPLFNATWRTIAGLSGMIFRKPPQVKLPSTVESMTADITMAGESLESFTKKITEEAIKIGRVGVLVDFPQATEEGLTLAAAEAQGMRPKLTMYKAVSIYNWRTGRVNNNTVLTEVRLIEEHEVQKDEWTYECETRYRVLDLTAAGYRVRVYKVDDKGSEIQIGDDIFPLMRGNPLTYIPFIFIGTDDLTPDVDAPPLIDLVDMNVHHYQITAIKCNALPFAVPTMFIAGPLALEEGEKIYVGSSKAIHSTDPSSTASYIEYSGQGLGAVEKEIDKTEQQMAILGARMLEPQRTQVESADGQSIHRKGEESILAAVAQTISEGITTSLKWFVDWAGGSGEVSYKLNKDFYPVGMTPQMLTALLAGWQQGAYSEQVLFDNLQQSEIIDAAYTLEEEQARRGEVKPPAPDATQVQTEANAPADFTEIIAAVNALITKMGEQKPEMDLMPLMDAIKSMPAPIVNVAAAEQQAPVINMPAITVESPVINMPSQPITITMPEQVAAPITLNTNEGSKTINVQRDAAGNITGATVQ
jgi:hypothetical protein